MDYELLKARLLAISHLIMPKSWMPSDSWISKMNRLKYSDDADENDSCFVTFWTVAFSDEVWLLIAVEFRMGIMVVEINEGATVERV